jgi:hypothetical protein
MRAAPLLLCLCFCLLGAACGPTIGTARSSAGDPNADADRDGYTPGQGDCDDTDATVHPGAAETCDGKDHDCNGIADDVCDDDHDGYNACPGDPRCGSQTAKNGLPGGDCDDKNAYVNPAAYEIPANGIDDNCDGRIDEAVPACDTAGGSDAMAFGRAIDVCGPWLVSASLNAMGDPSARKVVTRFGSKLAPAGGAPHTMALLSTGVAYPDKSDKAFVSPRPGTVFTDSEKNPLQVPSANVCTGAMQQPLSMVNDLTVLTLTVKAPSNARAFTFRFNFFSAEYSDFIGYQFNDMFVVNLTSKMTSGNITFDTNGQPVTVNNGFFQACLSQPICGNCGACGGKLNCPGNMSCGHTCGKGNASLDGTGYDDPIANRKGQQVGGATDWLQTTAPITPGETFQLQFIIFDAVDHYYDSAVLIDQFEWLFNAVSGPTTIG